MKVILSESDFSNDRLSPVGRWVIEFDNGSDVNSLQNGIQKGGAGFWMEKRVHFVTKLSLMTKVDGLPMFLMTTAYGIAWRQYADVPDFIKHFNDPNEGKRYCRFATQQEIDLIHEWVKDRRL